MIEIMSAIKGAFDLYEDVYKKLKDQDTKEQLAKMHDELFTVRTLARKLVDENDMLKENNKKITFFNREYENYQLKEVCAGVFLHQFNTPEGSSSPEHHACPNCMTVDQKISSLQSEESRRATRGV